MAATQKEKKTEKGKMMVQSHIQELLFLELKVSSSKYTLQEVYNEVIRDLLNPSAGILELMEDDRGNVKVPGLSSVKAPNLSRVSQHELSMS